jgi:hypothetical protein
MLDRREKLARHSAPLPAGVTDQFELRQDGILTVRR